jgi:hypothetical protein
MVDDNCAHSGCTVTVHSVKLGVDLSDGDVIWSAKK